MMTIKQLTHKILSFHNKYINNKNIIATIEHFLGRYISVRFTYWTYKNGSIYKPLFNINKDIYTKQDYDDYIKEVNDELNLLSLTDE